MHGQGFFFQAFVYLTAAVISVPIAKRLGLGSVLGYLLAGVAIGPFALGFIGAEGEDLMHFAEFGVVMMLFLVGLELQPSLRWRLKVPILGLGGLQVLLTAALVTGVALAAGLRWQEALAVGMTFALSSTAIVLQTLAEKGLMKSAAGQSSFAVLLFQDIAVIPMLALFPLLATHGAGPGEAHDHTLWVETLPGWAQALVTLGAVAAVVVGGHYAIKPAFRYIARTRLREVFVAAALLLVIGIALLMSQVGLSPALGTFIAGVVLANSEYRHEIESDVEPFKGLLLGLFFLAVGASIDVSIIAASPGLIAGLVAALMLGKLLVLLASARVFKLGVDQSRRDVHRRQRVLDQRCTRSDGDADGRATAAATGSTSEGRAEESRPGRTPDGVDWNGDPSRRARRGDPHDSLRAHATRGRRGTGRDARERHVGALAPQARAEGADARRRGGADSAASGAAHRRRDVRRGPAPARLLACDREARSRPGGPRS